MPTSTTLADVVALLKNDAQIAAIVGARVYQSIAPADSQAPRLRVAVIGGEPSYTFSNSTAVNSIVEVVAYVDSASGVADAQTLANEVVSALHFTRPTINGVSGWSELLGEVLYGDDKTFATATMRFRIVA